MVTSKLHLCLKNISFHRKIPFLGIEPEEIIIIVNIVVFLKDAGQRGR